jgi:hypothetical protein
MKAKIDDEPETDMIKNIRDLYRGINDFKVCHPRTYIVRMRTVIGLQTATVFWLSGETISQSY